MIFFEVLRNIQSIMQYEYQLQLACVSLTTGLYNFRHTHTKHEVSFIVQFYEWIYKYSLL